MAANNSLEPMMTESKLMKIYLLAKGQWNYRGKSVADNTWKYHTLTPHRKWPLLISWFIYYSLHKELDLSVKEALKKANWIGIEPVVGSNIEITIGRSVK